MPWTLGLNVHDYKLDGIKRVAAALILEFVM
jgi:hypothetical protein